MTGSRDQRLHVRPGSAAAGPAARGGNPFAHTFPSQGQATGSRGEIAAVFDQLLGDWTGAMTTKDRKAHDAEGRIPMPEAMRAAMRQLSELLQNEPSGVSALKRTDEGWTAQVEVVEIARIPDTTSVMASYRVDLDAEGSLVAYERTGRYARGRVDH